MPGRKCPGIFLSHTEKETVMRWPVAVVVIGLTASLLWTCALAYAVAYGVSLLF